MMMEALMRNPKRVRIGMMILFTLIALFFWLAIDRYARFMYAFDYWLYGLVVGVNAGLYFVLDTGFFKPKYAQHLVIKINGQIVRDETRIIESNGGIVFEIRQEDSPPPTVH